MNKLTTEQAIVVTGYTGVCCCAFGLLQEEVEKRLGRPVWTHEFGSAEFAAKVKEIFKEDFLALCPSLEH